MMKRIVLILIAAVVITAGCGSDKPTLPDGEATLNVVIVDTTWTIPGSTQGIPAVVEGAAVSLQARTHEYVTAGEADDGSIGFTMLPAGEYSVFARLAVPIGAQKKVFTGFNDIDVPGSGLVTDTTHVSTVTVNALMINEIYSCVN